MDDTAAVLDPETSTDEEAPEEELTDQVEETEDEEASETETFTEEELEQRIEAARKETEERIRSEERERAETAALEANRTRSKQFLEQRAFELLRNQAARAAKLGNDGREPEEVAAGLQRVHLQELVEGVQGYAYQFAFDSLQGHYFTHLQKQYPDYKMPAEKAQRYAKEVASGQTERVFAALYEAMQDAVLSTEVPKRLDEERKAAAEKNKKGEAVKNLQNPPKSGGPAKVGGSSNNVPVMTMAQIDAMPTNQWLAMPKEQRDKIRENALRRAAGQRG